MKKKVFTFYIGLEDKDLKRQVISVDKAKLIINQVFDNYTLFVATGVYRYIDNSFCNETTLIVKYIDVADELSEKTIKNICRYLKTQLNQELIAVEYHYSNCKMY